MSVEVACWNASDNFADPQKSRGALEVIKHADADIAVFSEAYRETERSSYALKETVDDLSRLGYSVSRVLYSDTDGRGDRHGLVVINRLGCEAQRLDMDTRSGLVVRNVPRTGSSATYDFMGMHLDDRTEDGRLDQTGFVLSAVREDVPTILAGDLNTMKGDLPIARMFRAAGVASKMLGTIDPEEYKLLQGIDRKKKIPARVGSLLERLSMMAEGKTMAALENAGFRDTHTLHQPTINMFGKIAVAQLDHIMVTEHFTVLEAKKPVNTPFSDHRLVAATVSL